MRVPLAVPVQFAAPCCGLVLGYIIRIRQTLQLGSLSRRKLSNMRPCKSSTSARP